MKRNIHADHPVAQEDACGKASLKQRMDIVTQHGASQADGGGSPTGGARLACA